MRTTSKNLTLEGALAKGALNLKTFTCRKIMKTITMATIFTLYTVAFTSEIKTWLTRSASALGQNAG